MRRLPRPGEQIFNTGKQFTPSELPLAWATTVAEIEAAVGTGGASGGPAFGAWARTGRLQLATGAADTPPRTPSTPGLVVVLPVGFAWLQEGALFVVSEDDGVKYLEVPANFKGTLALQVLDGEDGAQTWTHTPAATRGALGSGALCAIETDADGVTLLDASATSADVIPALPLILRRLQVLEGTPSNGGSGGGGGVPQAEFDALQQQLDQLRADFEAFRASIAGDSIVPVGFESPTLLVNTGKLIAHAVYQDASSAKSFLAGVDMPGGTGYAQDWNGEAAPLVRIGGNADYDEETGVIR